MLRNIKTEIKIKKFGSILLRILPFELSAVIVIVVPSSTAFPTSILCFNTVPVSFAVSSSYTTSTFSFASVSSFLAASSVLPITYGTDTCSFALALGLELESRFYFWPPHCIGSSPGQGSDLSCSCSNDRSLTHCAGLGIKPASWLCRDAANSIVP